MAIKSSQYTPAFVKSITSDFRPIEARYADFQLSDSNFGATGSFKYEPLDYPLRSTQQLNVDWSKFENHTFFGSAEVKVNEAFNKIINGYPFDGSKKEVEQFLDSLTGFEKYVFDQFPRWAGALHFSGTAVGEDPSNGYSSELGTWISVKDKSGVLYPQLAKNGTGEVVINPGDDDSLSVETILYIPETVNDTQVVFQKTSSPDQGFTFHLEPSISTSYVDAVFSVSSGSYRNSVQHTILKGVGNYVCLSLNKETRENRLQLYVNYEMVAESKNSVRFFDLGTSTADLLIGSGSSFFSSNTLVTPTQTFSGTMDEFKVFHEARDAQSQRLDSVRGMYSKPTLRLYYRFNEPSGSLSLNNATGIETIVLDSSGNSLHSNVRNFGVSTRMNVSGSTTNPMTYEKAEFKTVLFPAYPDVLTLNTTLLETAKEYDRNNPNNIIRLVPKHYLLEGASQDGFIEPEGKGGDPYGGSGIPGQGERGSVQVILTFLYIWSKFFDELKLFVDSFVTLRTVKYDSEDSIPDNFLEDVVRQYGLYLPKFFNHSTLEQFAEGQNIEGLTDISTPLKKLQAAIVRRILVNLPDVLRSKGTQHSIRSFLRSVGVDPENSLKIREYGGITTRQLASARENRMMPGAMVKFLTSSLVTTSFLSGSRVEPGWPHPQGSFYYDSSGKRAGTSVASDGLLTSGSWNIECLFKVPPSTLESVTTPDKVQSLLRMCVTGSGLGSDPGIVANIVAHQRIDYPFRPASLTAYVRSGHTTSAPILSMSFSMRGNGIFDGDKWNVSLGRRRHDDGAEYLSSSYYLRAGKTTAGQVDESYEIIESFFEDETLHGNVFGLINSGSNASGSFISIGEAQQIDAGIGRSFLNDTFNADDVTRTTQFVGWAGNLRFWSKAMSVEEWREHVRNPTSVGVSDPYMNYNHVTNVSGSFQKLRLDTLQKQAERNSDGAGDITFLDFSQNNSVTNGSGFLPTSSVLVGDVFSYSYLSPAFDEAATDDKIRIRGFKDSELLAENPFAVSSPTFLSSDLMAAEEPIDDPRLSIEFSLVDSLDRDIVRMFSTLETLGDALGSPENAFSPDYPDLERLRDIYFNRLSSRPDFKRFFEFYRWFDASISTFIDQLIPSKTVFKGTNFVVESHLLERHKYEYRHSDNYLGRKQTIDDSLLVQQIVGRVRKY